MNILIIGSGGREHAFAWKIRQSQKCKALYVAPGNGGTSQLAENVPIAVEDFEKLGQFCLEKKIDLVLVGPEAPLVKGIRDHFSSRAELKSIRMVGPDARGAMLEGSKDFSKQFMIRHHVPTAKARTFHSGQLPEALTYIDACKPPVVLKADGLAAGKGVIISSDLENARQAMREMLEEKKFGEAGSKVLVEEFLNGIELSVFVLTDGSNYVILPEAKDYKRIGDGDTGPNTGGMGSVSPVSFATEEFLKKVEERVVKPTVKGLKDEGIDYKGFIFIGLMNVEGNPYVIEYNARMGDPETQSVMMRIENDFVELLVATADGNLDKQIIKHSSETVVTVVMASGGYPEHFEKGKIIQGLEGNHPARVFHASTKKSEDKIVTDGGRVLGITARGRNLEEARQKAYDTAHAIHWDNAYFRKDIGVDLLKMF